MMQILVGSSFLDRVSGQGGVVHTLESPPTNQRRNNPSILF